MAYSSFLIHIHTHPPRPSKFTSAPSYRLPERSSTIASHIAEILPDRTLYLHFCTKTHCRIQFAIICEILATEEVLKWWSEQVEVGWRQNRAVQIRNGEESPSIIPVSQVSHPWPKMCINQRFVAMNGDVHVNVRPLVPDVTL